jgi:hypothetical protein
MANLKLAFRRLVKTPFVTIVAVMSLALGIGANAAIFSMFDQMLLAPLPVKEPGRLVNLGAPGPKPGSQTCSQAGDCDVVFSYPMFRDLEKADTGFSGIAAHRIFGANVAYRGQTFNGDGLMVSGSYFPVLGLQPALGRLLGPEDDMTVGQPARIESIRAQRSDHRQRSVDDDRGCGAARLRRDHPWCQAATLRARDDAWPHGAGLERL